ncbi:hypothetical protein NAPIS_ORF00734 [Vairimorpha apis BRL 01]|uniref:Uncharacterized protein n=1 Tax=Vairimorpha apis BRL 01 TaxID=1037528 RepID=T0MF29_9MICR|nr:hypothetical protein NAPIS_ORF00734 [Vairimorpha apis BRL 01]
MLLNINIIIVNIFIPGISLTNFCNDNNTFYDLQINCLFNDYNFNLGTDNYEFNNGIDHYNLDLINYNEVSSYIQDFHENNELFNGELGSVSNYNLLLEDTLNYKIEDEGSLNLSFNNEMKLEDVLNYKIEDEGSLNVNFNDEMKQKDALSYNFEDAMEIDVVSDNHLEGENQLKNTLNKNIKDTSNKIFEKYSKLNKNLIDEKKLVESKSIIPNIENKNTKIDKNTENGIFLVPTSKNRPIRKKLIKNKNVINIKNSQFYNIKNSYNFRNTVSINNKNGISIDKLKNVTNNKKIYQNLENNKTKNNLDEYRLPYNIKNRQIQENQINLNANNNNNKCNNNNKIYQNTDFELFEKSSEFTIIYLKKLLILIKNFNNPNFINIQIKKDLTISERLALIFTLNKQILKSKKIRFLTSKLTEKIENFFENAKNGYHTIYKHKNCYKQLKADFKLKIGTDLTENILSSVISKYIYMLDSNEDVYLFGQCLIIILIEFDRQTKVDQLIKLFFVIQKSIKNINESKCVIDINEKKSNKQLTNNNEELLICKIKTLIDIINPDINFKIKRRINLILHKIYKNRKLFRMKFCSDENLTTDSMISNYVNIILYMAFPKNKYGCINLVRPECNYYYIYCMFLQNNYKIIWKLFK